MQHLNNLFSSWYSSLSLLQRIQFDREVEAVLAKEKLMMQKRIMTDV